MSRFLAILLLLFPFVLPGCAARQIDRGTVSISASPGPDTPRAARSGEMHVEGSAEGRAGELAHRVFESPEGSRLGVRREQPMSTGLANGAEDQGTPLGRSARVLPMNPRLPAGNRPAAAEQPSSAMQRSSTLDALASELLDDLMRAQSAPSVTTAGPIDESSDGGVNRVAQGSGALLLAPTFLLRGGVQSGGTQQLTRALSSAVDSRRGLQRLPFEPGSMEIAREAIVSTVITRGSQKDLLVCAYRVELGTTRIVGIAGRALPFESIDLTPSRFFRDQLMLGADAAPLPHDVRCDDPVARHAGSPGRAALKGSAALQPAILAYDRQQDGEAARLFGALDPSLAPHRVQTGRYLSNLGRDPEEARKAREALIAGVDAGSHFVVDPKFAAGSIHRSGDARVLNDLDLWLKGVSARVVRSGRCMLVAAPALQARELLAQSPAPTRSDVEPERGFMRSEHAAHQLAAKRADFIRSRILAQGILNEAQVRARVLDDAMEPSGLGTGDLRDQWDRSVYLKPGLCL